MQISLFSNDVQGLPSQIRPGSVSNYECCPAIQPNYSGKLQRPIQLHYSLGIRQEPVKFPGFRCYAGERVVWDRSLAQMLGIREPVATPDVSYPSAWIIPQWRTDEILHARLMRLGIQAEFSTELTGFEQV